MSDSSLPHQAAASPKVSRAVDGKSSNCSDAAAITASLQKTSAALSDSGNDQKRTLAPPGELLSTAKRARYSSTSSAVLSAGAAPTSNSCLRLPRTPTPAPASCSASKTPSSHTPLLDAKKSSEISVPPSQLSSLARDLKLKPSSYGLGLPATVKPELVQHHPTPAALGLPLPPAPPLYLNPAYYSPFLPLPTAYAAPYYHPILPYLSGIERSTDALYQMRRGSPFDHGRTAHDFYDGLCGRRSIATPGPYLHHPLDVPLDFSTGHSDVKRGQGQANGRHGSDKREPKSTSKR